MTKVVALKKQFTSRYKCVIYVEFALHRYGVVRSNA